MSEQLKTGADVGPELDLEPLFTPFALGELTLRNRFVMAPMGMRGQAGPGGVPLPEIVGERLRRRVEGGVGLILNEGSCIDHPASEHGPSVVMYGEAAFAGWRGGVGGVKGAGGLLYGQVNHSRAQRNPAETDHPDAESISPSGLRAPGAPNGRAMTQADIDDVLAAYSRAAAAEREIGFDGIEIMAGSGFLIDEFLWSETNLRTDAYGGDLESRARFCCEVVGAVRAAVGAGFPVSLQLSQYKREDLDAKIAHSPAELEALLGWFREAGVDIFHMVSQRFWEPAFEGSDLSFAGWAKKLTDAVVMT